MSITVSLDGAPDDDSYYWISIPLEKRFTLGDGEPVPDAFPFHLEGSILPFLGPLGKLGRIFNPDKHLISSESIQLSGAA